MTDPCSSTSARPAGRQDERRLRQLEHGRALEAVARGGSPRPTKASCHSSPKWTRRELSSSSPAVRRAELRAPALRLRTGPGGSRPARPARPAPRSRSAARGPRRTPLHQLVRGRLGSGLDRELERLALVAKLVGDRLRVRRPSPRRGSSAELGDRGGDGLARQLARGSSSPCAPCRACEPKPGGRAPRGRRRLAGRSAASSPSPRRARRRASGRRRRTAGARSSRGSMPRLTVTTRSARTISAFASRTMPVAVSSSSRPSSEPSARDGCRRGLRVELEVARQARVRRPGGPRTRFASVTVASVPPRP